MGDQNHRPSESGVVRKLQAKRKKAQVWTIIYTNLHVLQWIMNFTMNVDNM